MEISGVATGGEGRKEEAAERQVRKLAPKQWAASTLLSEMWLPPYIVSWLYTCLAAVLYRIQPSKHLMVYRRL